MTQVMCGVTPESIVELDPGQIFVFGSNLVGYHGAGAARAALKWGAEMGVGVSLSGQTYALPTKDGLIQTMTLPDIEYHIDELIGCIVENPDKHFLITKIGCGLAGYTPKDIAPLFGVAFLEMANCSLPQEFIDIIQQQEKEAA